MEVYFFCIKIRDYVRFVDISEEIHTTLKEENNMPLVNIKPVPC